MAWRIGISALCRMDLKAISVLAHSLTMVHGTMGRIN